MEKVSEIQFSYPFIILTKAKDINCVIGFQTKNLITLKIRTQICICMALALIDF
jgi:hypothetical protein